MIYEVRHTQTVQSVLEFTETLFKKKKKFSIQSPKSEILTLLNSVQFITDSKAIEL